MNSQIDLAGSAYVALRCTASGTPNYQVGVTWEE